MFFERLGFSVESHSLLKVADQIVSGKKLNVTHEAVAELIGSVVVFVMNIQDD